MRTPAATALLFVLLLVGWFASRPIQDLLARHAPEPPASPPAAREVPRMTVRAVESVASPVSPELVLNGRTEPRRMVRVRAETDGRVVATPMAEGSPVEPGTVILRLDRRDREARVAEARALVAQRELEFEAARRLGEKQFQTETRVAETRALLEAARAALVAAELDLARTEVRAPFAGVLEERAVEVGDFANTGDELALVIEQDPFLVAGDAPETLVGRFQVGEPGLAQLADGRTFAGRVRYVATRADPATRTFRVELEVENPEGRFPAGMSARVLVREPAVPAHRVSAATLVLADDGSVGIKSVDAEGIVRFHAARIVKPEVDAVWLGGLPERLRVVTTGQGFVAAGEAVEVELAPPAAALAEGEPPA